MSRARWACVLIFFLLGSTLVLDQQEDQWFVLAIMATCLIGAMPDRRYRKVICEVERIVLKAISSLGPSPHTLEIASKVEEMRGRPMAAAVAAAALTGMWKNGLLDARMGGPPATGYPPIVYYSITDKGRLELRIAEGE